MSLDSGAPPAEEVDRFLQRLRIRRDRLVEFAGGELTPELARAVDEVGEDLLVADEELRVQAEQLAQSTQHLDRLVRAYEELFADSPVAYVHTDADGLVLRVNRAAAQLLDIGPASKRSRTLAGALRPADRPALRQVLTRLRTASGASIARSHEPIEAAVLRADGAEVPVLISARRTRDAETGALSVHWEIRDRSTAPPPARRPLIQRGGGPAITLVAQAIARLAAADGPAELAARAVDEVRRLVPAAEEAAVFTVRGRGRLATSTATGDGAARADGLQLELDEGPAITALGSGRPVVVPDLARDARWPRLGQVASTLGVRSVIAVPLTGARGPVGVLSLYSRAPAAFDSDDSVIATAYAHHAGLVYAQHEVAANLRVALETREAVGQAVGILMERYRLPATAAFDRLVAVSQQSHRKLRDVALRVVETGEDPEMIVVPPLG